MADSTADKNASAEKARVQQLLADMKLMSKISYNFKYQARAQEVILPAPPTSLSVARFLVSVFAPACQTSARADRWSKIGGLAEGDEDDSPGSPTAA